MLAQLVPATAALLCVLVAGLLAVLTARAIAVRGMGRGPMVGLTRATCPTRKGVERPARPLPASLRPSHPLGAALRVIRRSSEPRGAAPAKPWPFSSLDKQRAAGAPAL